MATEKKMGIVPRILFIIAALAAAFAIVTIFADGSETSGSGSKGSDSAPAESSQAEAKAVQGATMSVTPKRIEDLGGLQTAQFSMMAKNESDAECTFAIDLKTASVNSTSITPLGGSMSVVKPGNDVALVYQAPFAQFGAESLEDVQQIEFDIVQYAGDSMINADGSSTEIDRVHVVMTP